MVTSRDITEAADGLRGIARRTQLLYVEELGVHLKLENEQPIGAFKIRGAYNAIRKLPDPARKRGVITFSSGNHGQAVAFAAKQFGVDATKALKDRGLELEGMLEIPIGPCSSFTTPGGHRVAVYQRTRPEVLAHFEGRRDF